MSDTPSSRRVRNRPASIGYDAVVLRAEKDTDDLANPSTRVRPMFLHQNSTRTEVGKLFSAQSPSSPSSSRRPSLNTQDPHAAYTRNMFANERTDVGSHLYQRGYIEGRHSDITVIAFGKRFPLHRLILDRAPFFSSALSPPWLESTTKEVTLHPEQSDSTITKQAFQFALKHLYGSDEPVDPSGDPFGVLATASWLEMQDLIDDSVEAILCSLNTTNLAHALDILAENCYGEAGNKILAAAKFMLNREGHDLPPDYWDELPAETIREVIGNDGFFANSEWDRWILAKDIFNSRLRSVADELGFAGQDGRLVKAPRKIRNLVGRLGALGIERGEPDSEDLGPEYRKWISLYSHPEVKPLLAMLDNDIYYLHLSFEELQIIRAARDCFGLLTVPEKLINDALWSSMELRQRIVNSKATDLTLGLTIARGPEHPSTFLSMQMSPKIIAEDSASQVVVSPPESRRASHEVKPDYVKYRVPTTDCNIASGTAKLSSRYNRTVFADQHALRHSPRVDGPSRPPYYASSQLPETSNAELYSTLPPFRFAVQFDRPHGLPERRRESSDIFFYAGSYWNIYIQRMPASSRSKPPRLGFYLHRVEHAADSDRFTANVVDERSLRGLRHPRDQPVPWPEYKSRVYDNSDAEDPSSNVRAAMQTIMARPSSSRRSDLPQIPTLPFEDSEMFSSHQRPQPQPYSSPIERTKVSALPSYVDTRPEVHAYFKVYVFSPDGRCNNCYQSAIAPFRRAQSWGWKSSTLLAEEDWYGKDDEEEVLGRNMASLEVDCDGGDGEEWGESGAGGKGRASPGSEGRLRFMVVLGVV